jgi:hypothetical protein
MLVLIVAVAVKAFETAQTAEFANKRDLVKELTLEELELIAADRNYPTRSKHSFALGPGEGNISIWDPYFLTMLRSVMCAIYLRQSEHI